MSHPQKVNFNVIFFGIVFALANWSDQPDYLLELTNPRREQPMGVKLVNSNPIDGRKNRASKS